MSCQSNVKWNLRSQKMMEWIKQSIFSVSIVVSGMFSYMLQISVLHYLCSRFYLYHILYANLLWSESCLQRFSATTCWYRISWPLSKCLCSSMYRTIHTKNLPVHWCYIQDMWRSQRYRVGSCSELLETKQNLFQCKMMTVSAFLWLMVNKIVEMVS